MKSKFKPIVMLAAFCFVAISCQKETVVDTDTAFHLQQNAFVRCINYNIDDVSFNVTIFGEHNWQLFLDEMIALTQNGHKVTIRRSDVSASNDKSRNVVVFETTNETEAHKWCNEMIDKGYEVTMTYDPRTGKYTCTAIGPDRTDSQSDTIS
ncbi:MAG: hypothetical protein J6031_00280 [Bacteroidales bacterium]|nr:hypothetical protein [Bacteroidales bacterium]